MVINASTEGLLLESPGDLDPDAEIEIITSLEDGSQKVSTMGKVVRVDRMRAKNKNRFGIELLDKNETWEKFMAP